MCDNELIKIVFFCFFSKLETWSLISYNTEANDVLTHFDSQLIWNNEKTNRDIWEIEACANDKIFRVNCANQDQIDR